MRRGLLDVRGSVSSRGVALTGLTSAAWARNALGVATGAIGNPVAAGGSIAGMTATYPDDAVGIAVGGSSDNASGGRSRKSSSHAGTLCHAVVDEGIASGGRVAVGPVASVASGCSRAR